MSKVNKVLVILSILESEMKKLVKNSSFAIFKINYVIFIMYPIQMTHISNIYIYQLFKTNIRPSKSLFIQSLFKMKGFVTFRGSSLFALYTLREVPKRSSSRGTKQRCKGRSAASWRLHGEALLSRAQLRVGVRTPSNNPFAVLADSLFKS